MNRGKFILVVEDDASIREIVSEILQLQGYDVLEAKDAFEALRILARAPLPSWILLDQFMPGMNGMELMVHFRSFPQLLAIPVTLFTAGTDLALDPANANVECIRKPIRIEELLALAAKHCA